MRDVHIWFWVWVMLAVILSVAEIFTAGFFILPFGIGAACAAVLEYVAPGTIGWQWAVFLGVSVALLIVLRRFAERVTHESPVKVAGDRLIGKPGVVVTRLEEHAERGMVRVEREEWRADAPGYEPLDPGARVVVVSVEGTHLVVRPADGVQAE